MAETRIDHCHRLRASEICSRNLQDGFLQQLKGFETRSKDRATAPKNRAGEDFCFKRLCSLTLGSRLARLLSRQFLFADRFLGKGEDRLAARSEGSVSPTLHRTGQKPQGQRTFMLQTVMFSDPWLAACGPFEADRDLVDRNVRQWHVLSRQFLFTNRFPRNGEDRLAARSEGSVSPTLDLTVICGAPRPAW